MKKNMAEERFQLRERSQNLGLLHTKELMMTQDFFHIKKKNDDEDCSSYTKKYDDEECSSYKKKYDDQGRKRKREDGGSSPKRKYDHKRLSKYSRPNVRHSETEWRKLYPVRDKSRERKRADRSYSDEEHLEKVNPKPTVRSRTHQDIPDLQRDRLVTDNSLYPAPEGKKVCHDLREVLKERKGHVIASTATKATEAVTKSATASSEANNVLELICHLVIDMSPELFLTLALVKLEQMNVQSDTELELLKRFGSEATTLVLKARNKLPIADSKTKYENSFAQNGASSHYEASCTPQNGQQFQQNLDTPQSKQPFEQSLDNFLGHYKACKTASYEEGHSNRFFSSHLGSSENPYVNSVASTTVVREVSDSSVYQDILESKKPVSCNIDSYHKSLNSSLPFQGVLSSNKPVSIPGLTLTDESTKPSAPIHLFTQAVKKNFGNINVPPTQSSQNPSNDYNRLHFRY